MYCGQDFSPADQAESELYSIDFVDDLPPGETLSSAVWTCTVSAESAATDPNPSARITAGPFAPDSTSTAVRCAGFLPNVTYILTALGTASGGNLISLFTHVLGEDQF